MPTPASPADTAIVDEDEDVPCYRHPTRLTALRCIDCDRPICSEECAIPAAVGFKCPDDARVSRAARAVVPHTRMATGALAGIATGLLLGGLLFFLNVPFFGIILGYLVGIAVGTVTRRASGGYRDPLLARIATIAAVVGVLLLPVLDAIVSGGVGQAMVWKLAAAAFAGYAAHQRASL
jgi:hypothetical protein